MENNNINEGIIELDDDNKEDILLFYKYLGGLEIYLNNEKVNSNKIEYNKLKEGKKFNFKIKFNYFLENLACLFLSCTNIVFLDFSNFNTSNVIDMGAIFRECKK